MTWGLSASGRLDSVFARLRARSGLDLVDFITLVEQDLCLDIEAAANDFRPMGPANLEAFFDAVDGYLAVDEPAGLGRLPRLAARGRMAGRPGAAAGGRRNRARCSC